MSAKYNIQLPTDAICLNAGRQVPIDDSDMQSVVMMSLRAVVKKVDLSHNSLTSDGCSYLARMMTNSKTISTLMLAHNPIGDAGVECLAGVLIKSSLTTLDLTGTVCLSLNLSISISLVAFN